ncbi:ScyD/ScyE family protein [Dactylosporangium sp. NPDC048998]|uniref:ScyD/ScyE family protein n=1 Tax=Dactylosporangium sp. NPDC048998 TaxID=3363976 RepID=UPI0037126945
MADQPLERQHCRRARRANGRRDRAEQPAADRRHRHRQPARRRVPATAATSASPPPAARPPTSPASATPARSAGCRCRRCSTTPRRSGSSPACCPGPIRRAARRPARRPSGHSVLDIRIALVDVPRVAVPDSIDKSTYGKLLESRWLGKPKVVADISGFEYAHDPDGQLAESNPYSLLALPGRMLIADAAGNDILQWRNGQLSVFSVLPNTVSGYCAGLPNDNGTVGCDPVPTGLAVDRDGSIYVSGLGNFSPSSGRVFKLDGRTGQILQTWDGLTGVAGIAVDRHGSVYASQLFANTVTRIDRDGTRTNIPVPFPGGLAVAGDSLYVSAYSTSPESGLGLPDVDSSGQVWRIRI